MKKGFEWSVHLLVAVIIAVIAAGILWAGLAGKTPMAKATDADTAKLSKGCDNENDCVNSLDGSKCLVIYPGDFTPFCGCLTSDDCLNTGGKLCGSNNKCT